jgi:hypothetical protein
MTKEVIKLFITTLLFLAFYAASSSGVSFSAWLEAVRPQIPNRRRVHSLFIFAALGCGRPTRMFLPEANEFLLAENDIDRAIAIRKQSKVVVFARSTTRQKTEDIMAWLRVENYWLGYSLPKKQFYFYYKLQGDPAAYQFFPSPEEFSALADMFRNEGPMNFNTDGKYFVTAAEQIGENEPAP